MRVSDAASSPVSRSVDREDVHGKYAACRWCELTFTRVIDACWVNGVALPGCAPIEQADRPEPRPSCLKLTAPRMELRFLSAARLLEMFDGDGGSALTAVNAGGMPRALRAVLVCRAPRPSGGRRSLDQPTSIPGRLWRRAAAVERLGTVSGSDAGACRSACAVNRRSAAGNYGGPLAAGR